MSADRRRGWFAEDESVREAGKLRRDYVSAVEVWAECFGNDPHRFPRQDRTEVNTILRQLNGWKEEPKRQRCGPYGQQDPVPPCRRMSGTGVVHRGTRGTKQGRACPTCPTRVPLDWYGPSY